MIEPLFSFFADLLFFRWLYGEKEGSTAKTVLEIVVLLLIVLFIVGAFLGWWW